MPDIVLIVQPATMLCIIYSYSTTFTEDGDSIYPLNTAGFFVTDDDNMFLIRATLTLENANPLYPDVTDQLFATSNNHFNVSQNGTSQLVIDAIGPQQLITLQTEFVDFLKTVQFTTDDQAPEVLRNLSLVVEEFPVGEAPSRPAYITITIIPVNDRPILNSSLISDDTLDRYLSSNQGFVASFLLSNSNAIDVDRRSSISLDFIGLAIVSNSHSDSLGFWQYWSRNDMDWVNLPVNISNCYPLLANPDTRIRFLPEPNLAKEDGMATFEYRAWDGSSQDFFCENATVELNASKLIQHRWWWV